MAKKRRRKPALSSEGSELVVKGFGAIRIGASPAVRERAAQASHERLRTAVRLKDGQLERATRDAIAASSHRMVKTSVARNLLQAGKTVYLANPEGRVVLIDAKGRTVAEAKDGTKEIKVVDERSGPKRNQPSKTVKFTKTGLSDSGTYVLLIDGQTSDVVET